MSPDVSSCIRKNRSEQPSPTTTYTTWVFLTTKQSVRVCAQQLQKKQRSLRIFAKLMFFFLLHFTSSWWFSFNPFETYAPQIWSFPQGSGWKFKKYLSCHHLDLQDFAAWTLVKFVGKSYQTSRPQTSAAKSVVNSSSLRALRSA